MSEKQLITIYYSYDVEGAKKLATMFRAKGDSPRMIDACMFDGADDCEGVVIMPDVPEWRKDSIEAAYGELIITQELPEAEIVAPEVAAIDVPRPRGRPRKVV